ncbi:hypothetical protein Tco_0661694 [Tanacetum coccineum]
MVHFGKKGKLEPRFVGPFEIIEKVGLVAYRLRLHEELNGVHNRFHVSNLKKCLADRTLQVPLDEIQVNAKLNFVEEPIKILKREFKKLKQSAWQGVCLAWIAMFVKGCPIVNAPVLIMLLKMTTQSVGRPAAASRGEGVGGRAGRGGGRTRGQSGDQGNGGIKGQCGQVGGQGGQGTKVNDGVNGVPDFSTIIAQHLKNLLPTILTQVGSQGSDQGNVGN